MASYHLSAGVIARTAGYSSVAAAAYRARCALNDERTGTLHDYSRKSGELLWQGIYAPKDAPEWARERAQLWNHVEAFERRRDAQLARSFDIALPHELSLEQNRYALQDWVRENFTRKGLIADAVIHAPGRDGDRRNIHAHVMVVMRKLDGTEFAAKKERIERLADRKAELETLRESWERIGNRHLERYGHAPTLDRRTLLAQGIDREPTVHLGKHATAIERDGKATQLGDINREIKGQVIDLAAARAAREAAQARLERSGPASTPEKQFGAASRNTTAPARAREAGSARSQPGEARSTPTAHPRDGMRSASGVAGGFLGSVGSLLAGFIEGLANAISPPPRLTPEQQERAERAAEERAAVQEHEAAKAEAEEQLDQQQRDIRARLEQQLKEELERQRQGREEDYPRGRER
jgi:MobA/MobL family